VAEGARLESVYTGNRIVGSNPTPSARDNNLIQFYFLSLFWEPPRHGVRFSCRGTLGRNMRRSFARCFSARRAFSTTPIAQSGSSGDLCHAGLMRAVERARVAAFGTCQDLRLASGFPTFRRRCRD
jgi:hypothetical protein